MLQWTPFAVAAVAAGPASMHVGVEEAWAGAGNHAGADRDGVGVGHGGRHEPHVKQACARGRLDASPRSNIQTLAFP
jgi:hypothetical protein